METDSGKKLSRREMLKLSGGLAAGSLLGATVGGGGIAAAAPHLQQKEATYAVVNPVGAPTAKMITMATRLPDLNGKTVCEVGHHDDAFNIAVTFPIITQLLKQKYPTVKVIPYTDMPKDNRRLSGAEREANQKEIRDAIKAKGCDAVISGNGG